MGGHKRLIAPRPELTSYLRRVRTRPSWRAAFGEADRLGVCVIVYGLFVCVLGGGVRGSASGCRKIVCSCCTPAAMALVGHICTPRCTLVRRVCRERRRLQA
jgi:hypothetical protein